MPYQPETDEQASRTQLLRDLIRNSSPKALGENALALGSGLVSQAGTGLGVGAGMLSDVLRGRKPNLGAASDAIEAGAEKFTYAPRSEGGQELMRGLGTVMEPIDKGMQWAGQKTADVTGSPAAGAAVYTALNVLDPEMLAPGAVKAAALRGAGNIAREGAKTAVPMSEALRNVPKGQRGAYTLEDLNAVEGDFGMRSPTLDAFDKLKKQEQRVSGKQLLNALKREGAKPDEMAWMGLDEILNTDDVLDAADVRRIAEQNRPEMESVTQRGGEIDEDAIRQKVDELVNDDSDLEYPEMWYVNSYGERLQLPGLGRNRGYRDRAFDSESEAQAYVDEMRQQEYNYILENEGDHTPPEEWNAMSDAEKEAYADEAIGSFDEEHSLESETNYDDGPSNYDDLYNYWHERVTENPEEYDIAGGKPEWGEYTVGGYGDKRNDANYTVNALRLLREEKYGRNSTGPDPFTETNGQSVQQSPTIQREIARRLRRDEQAVPGQTERVNKTHFGDLGSNQMGFSRETDRPAPSWGSVQEGIGPTTPNGTEIMSPEGTNVTGQGVTASNPMRTLEEAQSDWYQAGRKAGWMTPEDEAVRRPIREQTEARNAAFREQALSEVPTALENPNIAPLIEGLDKLHPNDLGAAGSQMEGARNYLDRYRAVMAQDPPADLGTRLSAARNLFTGLYRVAEVGSPAEQLAGQMRNGLDNLPDSSAPNVNPLPKGPLNETKQYMQALAADTLRRAVMEGQQYVAFTPGDVHTQRWGTDTVQYAINPDDPMEVRWISQPETAKHPTGRPGETALSRLQTRAEDLLANPEEGSVLRLDDPEFDDKLRTIVGSKLAHGSYEYPDPSAEIARRAATLKHKMMKLAEKGTGAGHMSPRAEGFAKIYPTVEDYYAKLLRKLGSKREIQDIEPGLRGFEIDPEVAQAVKRGLPLPY